MRTNFLACFCALSGVALVGCPDPMTDPPDTNVSFVDATARDAGRDAPGDAGPADTGFSPRDACAIDGSACPADAFVGEDASLDAFGGER
jgi:hypothetical protein